MGAVVLKNDLQELVVLPNPIRRFLSSDHGALVFSVRSQVLVMHLVCACVFTFVRERCV